MDSPSVIELVEVDAERVDESTPVEAIAVSPHPDTNVPPGFNAKTSAESLPDPANTPHPQPTSVEDTQPTSYEGDLRSPEPDTSMVATITSILVPETSAGKWFCCIAVILICFVAVGFGGYAVVQATSENGGRDSTRPTTKPTESPSLRPNPTSTTRPTIAPTLSPSKSTISDPTLSPSSQPTVPPTLSPSKSPTSDPTPSPSRQPTIAPTMSPSKSPISDPTPSPSNQPTLAPAASPGSLPTASPEAPTSPVAPMMCQAGLPPFPNDAQRFVVQVLNNSTCTVCLGTDDGEYGTLFPGAVGSYRTGTRPCCPIFDSTTVTVFVQTESGAFVGKVSETTEFGGRLLILNGPDDCNPFSASGTWTLTVEIL